MLKRVLLPPEILQNIKSYLVILHAMADTDSLSLSIDMTREREREVYIGARVNNNISSPVIKG